MDDIVKELATHEAQLKALERRIETCEENNKALSQLAESVAKMSVTLQSTDTSIKELKQDVSELKAVPKTRLDMIITIIATAVGRGVIGYLLSLIL